MTLAPFKIWLCAAEAWQRSWAVIALPYMHSARACPRLRRPPLPFGLVQACRYAH
jgi:hypothetical protein